MNELNFANKFKRDMKKQPLELFISEEWTEVIACLSNGMVMIYC